MVLDHGLGLETGLETENCGLGLSLEELVLGLDLKIVVLIHH